VFLDISKDNTALIFRVKHTLLGSLDPADEGFTVLQNGRNHIAKSQEN
jgi:hypothetical protein